MVQTQFNRVVKIVRSDNGTEFMCLKNFYEENENFIPDFCGWTPQQNGHVEHKHRHILNVARANVSK